MKSYLIFLVLIINFSNCISQRLFPYRKNTLWGYCDSQKTIVIKPHYEFVLEFDNALDHGIVRKGNLFGIVNEKDSILLPFIFDVIKPLDHNYLVRKDEKWGLIDNNFKEVLPVEYSKIILLNNGRYFTIRHSISKKGKFYDSRIIIKKESNRILAKLKDNSIVVTYPDKEYIPRKKNYIFNNGNFAVHSGQDASLLKIGLYINRDSFHDTAFEYLPEMFYWEYKIIDEKGKEICKNNDKRFIYKGSNRFISFNYSSSSYDIYDDNFKKLNKESFIYYESGYYYNSFFKTQNKGYSYVYDTNGSLLVKFKGNIHQDILINRFWGQINWDSKWGLYDFNNRLIIDSNFDYISFSDKIKNRIVVGKNNKKGMIDINGRVIIPFMYSHLLNFYDGLAEAAFDDTTCGFIDTNNKVVIPFEYCVNNSSFNEGLAEVKKQINGNYLIGYINKRNETIIPIKYTSEYDVSSIQNSIGELWEHKKSGESESYRNRKFYFHSNGTVFYDP